MSSKGQIVIPRDFRDNFLEGEEILIVKDNDRIVLKNKSSLLKQTKNDLKFAENIEKAYIESECGNSKTFDFDKGIEELKKW